MSETPETPTPPEPTAEEAAYAAPMDEDLAAGYEHHDAGERLNKLGQVAVSVAVLVFAVVVAGGLASMRKKPSSRTPPPVKVGVRVSPVSDAPIQPTVVAFGRARPRRRVQISAQVAGVTSAINPALETGALLPEGAVAVEIDPTDYRSAYDQLRAQLAGAEADQNRLESQVAFIDSRLRTTRELYALEAEDLDRIQKLNKRGITNDRELSAARLTALRTRDTLTALQASAATLAPDLRKAAARLNEVQAQLARARTDLERCTIRMPFSGQLAKVAVERYQLLQRGQVLFEVMQVDRVEVPIVLSLGEAHLFARDLTRGFIRGQAPTAHVVYESRGEKLTWTGKLQRFETVDGDTQTVKAVVVVDNTNQESPLVPDLFCKVTLQAPPVSAGPAIPSDGLRERSQVYVVEEGKLRVRKVVTGRRLGRWIVIRAGLEAGEQVITSPLERAIEGMAVEVLARAEGRRAGEGKSK